MYRFIAQSHAVATVTCLLYLSLLTQFRMLCRALLRDVCGESHTYNDIRPFFFHTDEMFSMHLSVLCRLFIYGFLFN